MKRLNQQTHRVIFITLLNFLVLFGSSIGDTAATGSRTSILNHGPGVAASAKGDAFSAGGDDLSVIHYNSSLLMELERSQIYGMHWFLFEGARYNFLGWAQLMENSAFALSATQLYTDEIEVRKTIADTASKTSNSQVLIQGAYAGRYDRFKTNYGATMRYYTYRLYNYSASAFAGDFGLSRELYRIGTPVRNQLTVKSGLNIQNFISTPLKLNEEFERIPAIIRPALAASATVFPRYSKTKDNFSYDVVSVELNLAYTDSLSRYHLGGQYFFRDWIFLRVGLNHDRVTSGFGFIWNDIRFDYAWLPSDFTTLHQVAMLYKFGLEVERESQPFTEEFQASYKKSQRIYERCYRDATVLVEERKYRSAIDLLFKTSPLLPKDNAAAKELHRTCQNALSAEKVNEQLNIASQFESKLDYVGAYPYYLESLEISPEDKNILVYLDVSQKLMPSVREKINVIRDNFVIKVSSRIDNALRENDFLKAEKELKKLQTLNPKALQVQTLGNRISDLKQLYTQRILSQAIRNLQEDRPDLAFGLYSLALRLNPDDAMIKDQKYLSQNLFLKNRKYTLKDKLYADKLYYNAAVYFATGDNTKAAQTFERLRAFNPVHDFIEELEVPMIEKGILK